MTPETEWTAGYAGKNERCTECGVPAAWVFTLPSTPDATAQRVIRCIRHGHMFAKRHRISLPAPSWVRHQRQKHGE